MISLRIARQGYYSGDPGKVKNAPVDDVLRILDYEAFLNEYEFTEYKINEK